MVLSKGIQAVGLSCLGGAGGFIFARYVYPDVTYQEKTVVIISSFRAKISHCLLR